MNERLVPVNNGQSTEPSVQQHMEAVAHNFRVLGGQLRDSERLTELLPTASLSDVINALNIIIRRMNSERTG